MIKVAETSFNNDGNLRGMEIDVHEMNNYSRENQVHGILGYSPRVSLRLK